MLFKKVQFLLFGVLACETTFSLVEILYPPIRNFHFKAFRANTQNKMDYTMAKSICARKWCQMLCAFFCGHLCPLKDDLKDLKFHGSHQFNTKEGECQGGILGMSNRYSTENLHSKKLQAYP